MEWTVFFDNKGQYNSTRHCWNCMTMIVKNPLRPIYYDTSRMIIRAADLGKDYDLIHLYRYWKQRVELMKVEFSYQFERSILQKMWPSELLSDVMLIVEEQEFKVHRAVLALSSPYFTALFTRMKESGDVRIEIQESESQSFTQLLELIYGHRVVFKGINGARVLSLIKRFQIDGITDNQIRTMIESISIDATEFFEYIGIISEIYDGEHPRWFINPLL